MNKSNQGDIKNARIADGPEEIFFSLQDPIQGMIPLDKTKVEGMYSNSPSFLQAGNEYYIGLVLKGIVLTNMSNDYHVMLNGATLLGIPYLDLDKSMVIFKVRIKPSIMPKFTDMDSKLPDTLWSEFGVILDINGTVVSTKSLEALTLPYSFNPITMIGDGTRAWESNDMFLAIPPNTKVQIEMISGGGGGTGMSLVAPECTAATNGGSMALLMLEPCGYIKPLVAIEGGKGGIVNDKAFAEIDYVVPKSKNMIPFEGERCEDKHNPYVFWNINASVTESRMPPKDISVVDGVSGYRLADGESYGGSGAGVNSAEIGYRGVPGSSGQQAIVMISYRSIYDGTGPLLLLHPILNEARRGHFRTDLDFNNEPGEAGIHGKSPNQPGGDGEAGIMYTQCYKFGVQ